MKKKRSGCVEAIRFRKDGYASKSSSLHIIPSLIHKRKEDDED